MQAVSLKIDSDQPSEAVGVYHLEDTGDVGDNAKQ
jgi:hypothetical protein